MGEVKVYGTIRVRLKRVSNRDNTHISQDNTQHSKNSWILLQPQEFFRGNITERRLEVEEEEGKRGGGVRRRVTLLQMTSWAPGNLPHPTAVLSLVELLSKTQRSQPTRHATVICRSALLPLYVVYKCINGSTIIVYTSGTSE